MAMYDKYEKIITDDFLSNFIEHRNFEPEQVTQSLPPIPKSSGPINLLDYEKPVTEETFIVKAVVAKIFKIITKILAGKGLYKYRLVYRIYRKVRSVVSPDFLMIFGNKLFLDKDDDSDLFIKRELYEKNTSDFIINHINKGDNVIDVGANIGYTTLLLGKTVGENGYVYSFEPEQTNFDLLKQNVNVNKYQNVEPIQKIVSNKNGKIKFVIEDTAVIHHIDGGKGAFTKKHSIVRLDSVTLDDYIDGPIKFVKIDVEGHEIEVLNGMKSLIDKNKDLQLIVEFSIGNQRRAGYKPHQLLTLLEELGFDLFNVETQKKIILPLSDDAILKLGGCNLLCIKTLLD